MQGDGSKDLGGSTKEEIYAWRRNGNMEGGMEAWRWYKSKEGNESMEKGMKAWKEGLKHGGRNRRMDGRNEVFKYGGRERSIEKCGCMEGDRSM